MTIQANAFQNTNLANNRPMSRRFVDSIQRQMQNESPVSLSISDESRASLQRSKLNSLRNENNAQSTSQGQNENQTSNNLSIINAIEEFIIPYSLTPIGEPCNEYRLTTAFYSVASGRFVLDFNSLQRKYEEIQGELEEQFSGVVLDAKLTYLTEQLERVVESVAKGVALAVMNIALHGGSQEEINEFLSYALGEHFDENFLSQFSFNNLEQLVEEMTTTLIEMFNSIRQSLVENNIFSSVEEANNN